MCAIQQWYPLMAAAKAARHATPRHAKSCFSPWRPCVVLLLYPQSGETKSFPKGIVMPTAAERSIHKVTTVKYWLCVTPRQNFLGVGVVASSVVLCYACVLFRHIMAEKEDT